MSAIKPMKKAPTLAEASPYKSVADELEILRGMFREACQRYAERVEEEIVRLRERVVATGAAAAEQENSGKAATRTKQTVTLEKVHDLRDMLTLMRTMQLKPAEGRRKDLKKIESVLAELRVLSKGWA